MSATGHLPRSLYKDSIVKHRDVSFGGYRHTAFCADGGIFDMKNLSGDHYPIISTRAPRYKVRTLEGPRGMFASDGLYYVDKTGFYANGQKKGEVTDSRKQFASLGAYIVIFPDKKYYNRLTDSFGSLEAHWSGRVSISDGTYASEAAKANTISASEVDFSSIFSPGDAVCIEGCTAHPENNRTLIVREIEGGTLRFYEESFKIAEGGDNESITLSRNVPDMDFLCQNENRLWGCKGDTIYSSKLGDVFNWNVFDGLSTDSYSINVGSAGDFTAAVSYLGYPCFFKEEHIYKVYGDRPSNFQVMGSASLGVQQGSENSFGIAGECLFYLSRAGIVAYSGGIPKSIAADFGNERYTAAVGGSDGEKYYVSMRDGKGEWHLFVYDTRCGLWYREDSSEVISFAWSQNLYFLNSAGEIWACGGTQALSDGASFEGDFDSVCEFGDFFEGDPNKKGTSKLQLRMELSEGARVDVKIQFDSDGTWHRVRVLSSDRKRSFYLPIVPRRSDHYRIRLEGRGQWKLYSLVRESYSGSEI